MVPLNPMVGIEHVRPQAIALFRSTALHRRTFANAANANRPVLYAAHNIRFPFALFCPLHMLQNR